MKKRSTNRTHFEQINLVLAYINSHYGTYVNAEELAKISGYSLFHFHRIFKEITGESVNNYIKSTRLEKASNLLVYNQHKSIEEIALDVGFSTGTGFGAAFKKRFNMTPKVWRTSGYEINNIKKYKDTIVIKKDINTHIKTPTIVDIKNLPILYMRAFGYENDMSPLWNKLYEWGKQIDLLKDDCKFIGVFHNLPLSVPYDKARYLACIQTNQSIYRNGEIGCCRVTAGKFAKFEFVCTHEELYTMIHLAYINWLPKSGYEVRNFPSFVEYKNIDSVLKNSILEVDFYIPIQIIL